MAISVSEEEKLQCFSEKANRQRMISPDLPAQDFSLMADMLRHELPRVWYEEAQKILKTSDKEPTS